MYWTILEWASLSGPLTLVSHSTLFHWTCHFILSLYSCTICISTGPNLLSLSSRSSISCCRSADITLSRTRVSIDANASTLSLTFLLCCVTLEMKSVKRELWKQIFFNHHGLNWVTVKDSHGKNPKYTVCPTQIQHWAQVPQHRCLLKLLPAAHGFHQKFHWFIKHFFDQCCNCCCNHSLQLLTLLT